MFFKLTLSIFMSKLTFFSRHQFFEIGMFFAESLKWNKSVENHRIKETKRIYQRSKNSICAILHSTRCVIVSQIYCMFGNDRLCLPSKVCFQKQINWYNIDLLAINQELYLKIRGWLDYWNEVCFCEHFFVAH